MFPYFIHTVNLYNALFVDFILTPYMMPFMWILYWHLYNAISVDFILAPV
jgi:hypothetical protein